MRLESMTIAVTGAQQGIGAAIARQAAREGASVVVNWLDDEAAARAVADDVEAAGARAALVAGSVTDREAVQRMVEAGTALGGPRGLGGFVNNAGIFPRGRLSRHDSRTRNGTQVLGVNLKGTRSSARSAAARAMVAARQRPARSSTSPPMAAFTEAPAKGVHYGASEGRPNRYDPQHAALELGARTGIRVNAIAPGLTDTAQPRDGMTEAEIEAVGAGGPARPYRVARRKSPMLAVFLLNGRIASTITGQTLHVNGGEFLY